MIHKQQMFSSFKQQELTTISTCLAELRMQSGESRRTVGRRQNRMAISFVHAFGIVDLLRHSFRKRF